MKKNIHPDYHEATFVCACGATFKGKTCQKGKDIKLDVCNKCHPFFTGQQKLVDTSGRVDRFMKKHNLENK
ncbi:MAG: 50S ribosomal protein L31 [Clostridia bacterium]|nr:50S ribosomal protein L31 [Clostridia bacterium]